MLGILDPQDFVRVVDVVVVDLASQVGVRVLYIQPILAIERTRDLLSDRRRRAFRMPGSRLVSAEIVDCFFKIVVFRDAAECEAESTQGLEPIFFVPREHRLHLWGK